MRFVKVLTISIGLFVQSEPCFSDWSWASERMLVSDGISMYADRFEILPTDFCSGIKLRAWAKVADKSSNRVTPGDFLEIEFTLGDAPILNNVQVLGVHYDFDEDFDVLYLNFGEWDWSFGERITQNSDDALFAVYDDKKALIDSNIWEIGSLSDELQIMKSNCEVLDTGISA